MNRLLQENEVHLFFFFTKTIEITLNFQTKHSEQLRNEIKRNEQLEKQFTEIRHLHDQQMTANETRHSELSEQIGIIEKQR